MFMLRTTSGRDDVNEGTSREKKIFILAQFKPALMIDWGSIATWSFYRITLTVIWTIVRRKSIIKKNDKNVSLSNNSIQTLMPLYLVSEIYSQTNKILSEKYTL